MTNSHVAGMRTSTGITLFLNGKSYTVGADHPNFKRITDAFISQNFAALPGLMDLRASVVEWLKTNKEFTLVNDSISLNGKPFAESVTKKVLSMIDAGFPASPLFNFLRKVRNNPSKTSQDELLLFWMANKGLLHEDGDMIGYKAVRPDYRDIHSGKFDNSVGQTPKMDRGDVDDNRNKTCSAGLHVGAFEYSQTFGRWSGDFRTMVIKINPANIVSIPSDYHNQKCRASEYTVVGERKDGTELPHKEVYSNADLGIVPAVTAIPVVTTEPRKRSLAEKARSDRRKAFRASLTAQIASLEQEQEKNWMEWRENKILSIKDLRRRR